MIRRLTWMVAVAALVGSAAWAQDPRVEISGTVGYTFSDGVSGSGVDIEGDEFTVDFTGSEEQVDQPLNVTIGMTETVAKLCFKAVTTPEEDSNAGQYRPLRVVAPEGSLYHAVYPAPTFTLWPAILAIDVVFKALAEALPGRIPVLPGNPVASSMIAPALLTW